MNILDHHAYVFEGNFEEIIPEIKKSIVDFSAIDVFEYAFENLSIDNARMIKDLDTKAPLQGNKKYIIISLNSITREAQNALLKVFEDPTPSSCFFIITPSSKIFIETVLSRVEVVRHSSFGSNQSPLSPEIFIKSSLKERLKLVSELLSDIDDEKLSKQNIIYFLFALRNYIENNIALNPEYKKILPVVLNSIRFSADKSCSVKLLLERVCLC